MADNAPNARYRAFVAKFRKVCHKYSIYTTIAGCMFTLIVWSSGWHNIWGIGAALSALWGIAYFYLCHKKDVSPLKGVIVKNKFYNFLLTEGVFGYFYVFTWVQLIIIFWTSLQGILYY